MFGIQRVKRIHLGKSTKKIQERYFLYVAKTSRISSNFSLAGGVQIFTSEQPIGWGNLELPLLGLQQDWQGKPLIQALGFSLAMDPTQLWFIAAPQQLQQVHPEAVSGEFTPELWKHDVSELFLGDPSTGHYLEFNLAANGAWWAAKFCKPRQAQELQPSFQTQIQSYADLSSPSNPIAALSIPLDFLRREINLGKSTVSNVTFIQHSPAQIFISAAPLPGVDPDFHQPSHFLQLSKQALHAAG